MPRPGALSYTVRDRAHAAGRPGAAGRESPLARGEGARERARAPDIFRNGVATRTEVSVRHVSEVSALRRSCVRSRPKCRRLAAPPIDSRAGDRTDEIVEARTSVRVGLLALAAGLLLALCLGRCEPAAVECCVPPVDAARAAELDRPDQGSATRSDEKTHGCGNPDALCSRWCLRAPQEAPMEAAEVRDAALTTTSARCVVVLATDVPRAREAPWCARRRGHREEE